MRIIIDGLRAGRCATLVALAALTGCAGFSGDGGRAQVGQLVDARVGGTVSADASRDGGLVLSDADRAAVDDNTRQTLAHELTADDAVRLALLHNRKLTSAYADLQGAEADRVAAGRLANPGFGFRKTTQGSQREIERSVVFDVIGLFTLPMRARIADVRFEQTQLDVANQVLELAAQTRKAYFQAVAAQELVEQATQLQSLAQSRAELGQRLRQTGSWSRIDQLREQLLYAETAARLAQATQQARVDRERLTRLLGLWGDQAEYRLPAQLPELPAALAEPIDIERRAMASRLDVQMARRGVESTARSFGLTRATRFVNVLDVGYRHETVGGEADKNGWSVGFELPLFDFGAIATTRARAAYDKAFSDAAGLAIDARSSTREAYQRYRIAYDLARHYRDEIVPLYVRLNDESLLRYNGMQIGVMDLLAQTRMQMQANGEAIQARRDFWMAAAQLQFELGGTSEIL